ncbi:methyltransferase domain-containing protein [Streptomyces ipomoeae]|jgi:methyltransferase of ATP-grasp peptide maturase system|uniref:Protein-L-isoaspartate O-methyltransferase n=2 Tax=Streptomyces ipomoeae TaxID=103232 RepID=L1L1W2_9ACTN|nr:ATP-grasp peptide maturase system methyltransferase [Streptomyces ipomoeae]EKX66613.1 protein-L-isoaspartate(D-aspartate) O-methyltransferase (PCMT) [Streptomyces ipomoeae 91-03]MDX2697185.1 ATP-grasp peptide maturase system methyltransferase [Streptomyces ipomoeae]MDX2824746.1 ATP-grasp peptide maturase system methyltransferase [Streptomyces ipomoeae]MDX2843033.1 ATP-grasp peptide maturase system methyltransferase [Streptomyces ipomoeae]MDX2877391.1 ATP-grasp peptide maturase system methyl
MTDTPPSDEHRAVGLRQALADRLERGGHLRSAVWRSAVETVPRHEFVRAYFRRSDGPQGTVWTSLVPTRDDAETWLEEVYADDTLVTQLDGHVHPEDVHGSVQGDPTSSSTLPSLVVRMFQDLDPQDGGRVLEVGTGTGYSTALMCERLGSKNVTSVEVDPTAAERARAAIAAAGYEPTLVTGDGLLGHSENAPYDGLIATCSVRTIPAAWLAQVRPGGTIVTTVSGWLYGSGLVKLTVGDGGTAEGRFLPGTVSFMIARSHAAPPLTGVPELLSQDAEERPAQVGPEVLADWTAQFIAQLAVPNAQHFGMSTAGGPMLDHVVDLATKSFATLMPDGGGGFLVRQGGPTRLWDTVEEAIGTWRDAGTPPQTEFGLTVTPSHQQIWLGSPEGPRWNLPTQGALDTR